MRGNAVGREEEAEKRPNFLRVAETATPKDLADMIVDMVERSPSRQEVWNLVQSRPGCR